MNISLPRHLKKWVERQVVEKGFGTADELVLDMLRREKVRETRQRIDDRLLAALDSGESTPMTGKDWERIRAAGRKRFQLRHKTAV